MPFNPLDVWQGWQVLQLARIDRNAALIGDVCNDVKRTSCITNRGLVLAFKLAHLVKGLDRGQVIVSIPVYLGYDECPQLGVLKLAINQNPDFWQDGQPLLESFNHA